MFLFKNIAASPPQSRPVMIIDCKKEYAVFHKECFKFIEFATSKIGSSGNIEGVRSVSNHSFLYKDSQRVYTTTFSENLSWDMIKYFLKEYQSESTLLMDPTRRYALILGSNLEDSSCPECMEVKDTLKHSGVDSFIWYEKDFTAIYAKNFLEGPVRIELELKNEDSINQIKIFNYLYSIQHGLYAVPGIKTVLSPVNIYSFLNTVVTLRGNSPQERWESALTFWELSGERRSSYIDFQTKKLYMDIYVKKFNVEIVSSIQKILEKNGGVYFENWSIFDHDKKLISKKDDRAENKQSLTGQVDNEK